MRKHVKGNVSWVGYIDWEPESFHGDDYSIMTGDNILFSNDAFGQHYAVEELFNDVR